MNLNLKAISSLFQKKAVQTVAQETKTASSVFSAAAEVKQAVPEIIYATEAQIKAAAAKHTLRQSNSVAFDFGNQMKNNEAKALYNKLQSHSETLKKLEKGGAPEHLIKLQMKNPPLNTHPRTKSVNNLIQKK